MTSFARAFSLALLASVLAEIGGLGGLGKLAAASLPQQPPSLLLITLDTTRADAIGSYDNHEASTPSLDALASRGVRFSRAMSPAPLTLPAHVSMLTGLEPPEHGVHDNGIAALSKDIPTIATCLTRRGYSAGAVVASQVLDRRFGLDQGFAKYDDRMAAERTGEYGYPERDARAVTAAALAQLDELGATSPVFQWVHYYDPHAPYVSPSGRSGASTNKEGYADEIAFVDSQLAVLLAAWRARFARAVIAVVGDHGESLGEHGERTHGLFLYRGALEVPMIISAPGLSASVVVELVSTRRIAPSLLFLLGIANYGNFGFPLPGLGLEVEPQPVYSETWMPATAYGWSALTAFTDQRWRFISAPREELYDLESDPDESENVIIARSAEAARSRLLLSSYLSGMTARSAVKPELDSELTENLRSLGYLSGSSANAPRQGSSLDPKDGLGLLGELEKAESLRQAGNIEAYIAVLESLVERDSGNVPFTSRLAAALFAIGRTQRAIEMYRRAVELNPRLDFSLLHLAQAYHQLGQRNEARRAYRRVLDLTPRFAAAWLGLAEMAKDAGDVAGERQVLEQALEAGTTSAGISLRLAQLYLQQGEAAKASSLARSATELLPAWELSWYVRAQIETAQGEVPAAREALARVVQLSPGSPLAAKARELIRKLDGTRPRNDQQR